MRFILALVLAICIPAFVLADSPPVALETRLASEDRAEADRARDAGRKPAQVVEFLGVKPGMEVIDLIASGGYYTEVLSVAVGSSGKVYAQNSPFVLKLQDGAYDKEIAARLAGGRLSNVERVDLTLADASIEPGSLDVAFTALNFHDVFNSRGPEAAVAFLKSVRALLKPGGVLGLIDHHGDAEKDNEELHRIQLAHVRKSAEQAGFEIAAEGEMLRNPTDDRTQSVFDDDLRGKTDRFVLRLRKPAS